MGKIFLWSTALGSCGGGEFQTQISVSEGLQSTLPTQGLFRTDGRAAT